MKKKIKKLVRLIAPDTYMYLRNRKKYDAIQKFKKDYPFTKIFELIEKKNRKLYSQHNQDFLIYENFFKDKKNGFFCDIGGNHPLNINNTRYFEEIGWTGIAFEPLPYMEKLWKKHRKAKLFPFAISDKEEDVNFTIIQGNDGWEDMLSYVDETAKVDYEYKKESIIVKTKVLKNILEHDNISVIDYMSIDVEGHEENVLKSIDFSRVRVKVITIENSFGGAGDMKYYGDNKLRKVLFDNNFIFWGRIIGLDDIFVNKEYSDLLKNNEVN